MGGPLDLLVSRVPGVSRAVSHAMGHLPVPPGRVKGLLTLCWRAARGLGWDQRRGAEMGDGPGLRRVGVRLALIVPVCLLALVLGPVDASGAAAGPVEQAGHADLVVLAMQGGPRSATEIGITVGVRNLGPAAADGVRVTVGLPELGMRLVGDASSACRQPDAARLVCELAGTLAPSADAVFEAVLARGRLGGGEAAAFTFAASSATPDADLANNNGTFGVVLYPPSVDLAVRFVGVVEPAADPALGPGQVRVDLAVANKGPVFVTMVSFSLSLPPEIAFVSGHGGYGRPNELPSFVCSLDDPSAVSCWSLAGTMPPGHTDVIGIVLDASRASPGASYDLVASVAELRFGIDPVPGDNHAAFRIRVPAVAPATTPASTSTTSSVVPGAASTARPPLTLPETGGPSALPAAVGLAALVAGLALVLVGHHRSRRLPV